MLPEHSARTSEVLRAIIERLEASPRHTAVTLADALRAPVTADDLRPWLRFSDERYTRTRIASGPGWELRVHGWRPGQTTSLHGHRDAACAVRVVSGAATEVVLGQRDRAWAEGAVIAEPPPAIHQMGNAGPAPLVTLHAYSPPLEAESAPPVNTNVVIVGGGFSGIAAAYHLLRRAPAGLHVTVVERGPWLGRGVAYGVENPAYLLNVAAARMSLDPDVPDDFAAFAGADAHGFLPRALYGAYVEDRLGHAIRHSPGKLRIARAEAIALDEHGVHLRDGTVLPAHHIVLASGLPPSAAHSWRPQHARVIDGWNERGVAELPPDGRLLVVGTGLTALDVVCALDARGFSGSLTLLSRHGRLPRPHTDAPKPASLPELAPPSTARGLLRWARALVAEVEQNGGTWQHGIDAIRPRAAEAWRALSTEQRARFLRHLRPHWEVLRHRAPMATLARVDARRRNRQLDILSGAVVSCEANDDGVGVTLRTRTGEVLREHYDGVVCCTGPALVFDEAHAPLLTSLVRSGAAKRDPNGLGLVTNEDGAVVSASGAATQLYTLGALRRASSWESTAVPEISAQARALAERLLG